MKTTAIITAAGFGTRMNLKVPKQYLELGGVPILVHTLRQFVVATSIDEIIIVVPNNDEEFVRVHIVEENGLKKVRHIVSGGERRQDSIMNGLRAVSDETDVVVIHDGVRPFISVMMIDSIVEKVRDCDAVIFGLPLVDTLKRVDSGMNIVETIERTSLWRAQTPQAFNKRVILNAYMKAYKENFNGTDDAAIVEHAGNAVQIMIGMPENIKITSPEDLQFAEHLLTGRK